jgi:hypothetical protein
MTEHEAMNALAHLVGALNGFGDAAVDEYTHQFEKLDDPAALDDVCQTIARTWPERWKPTVAEVLARYYAHPAVRAEREARVARALMDDEYGSDRVVPWHEGQAIAADKYRDLHGREIGDKVIPNPAFAATLIENQDHRDRDGNALARYTDVLRGFRGDQQTTLASLAAIGPRLIRDNTGRLLLRPPPETPEPRYAPPAPTPLPEQSQAVSEPTAIGAGLSAALADTARRMNEDTDA